MGEPVETALPVYVIEPVRVALSGVMLPELAPGVFFVLPFIGKTERGAVRVYRHDGTAGKVHRQSDDVLRPYSGFFPDLAYNPAEDEQIIRGILQRPRRGQLLSARRKYPVDHPVGVVADRRRDLGSVRDRHQDRASRKSSEINSDRIVHFPHKKTGIFRGAGRRP